MIRRGRVSMYWDTSGSRPAFLWLLQMESVKQKIENQLFPRKSAGGGKNKNFRKKELRLAFWFYRATYGQNLPDAALQSCIPKLGIGSGLVYVRRELGEEVKEPGYLQGWRVFP